MKFPFAVPFVSSLTSRNPGKTRACAEYCPVSLSPRESCRVTSNAPSITALPNSSTSSGVRQPKPIVISIGSFSPPAEKSSTSSFGAASKKNSMAFKIVDLPALLPPISAVSGVVVRLTSVRDRRFLTWTVWICIWALFVALAASNDSGHCNRLTSSILSAVVSRGNGQKSRLRYSDCGTLCCVRQRAEPDRRMERATNRLNQTYSGNGTPAFLSIAACLRFRRAASKSWISSSNRACQLISAARWRNTEPKPIAARSM